MSEVIALIAAAGQGTRLGAEVPKAFVMLRGRSLVERSISAMVTSGVVDRIIVLLSADMMSFAQDLFSRRSLIDSRGYCQGIPVQLVCGGGERADSVWEGLKAIGPHKEGSVVLIHDAARALTPPGLIARVARAVAQGHKAVIPVLPVADTIKEVVEESGTTFVRSTPDRSRLRAVQTPQGFDLAELYAANLAYFAQETPDFIATDDASLMEWHGQRVSCVKGDPMAFKVTTPIDMTLAEHIVDEAEPTIFDVPDTLKKDADD